MNRAIVVLLLSIALMASWFYGFGPKDSSHYRLSVLNNTALTVDMVRVFGSGAIASAELQLLEPGQSGELNLGLRPAGQLRFEVMRGYNRIDAIFEDDVSTLQRDQLWLIINNNNHFVLAESAPQ